jgi:O-antigen/teichoic acid export membrane protein
VFRVWLALLALALASGVALVTWLAEPLTGLLLAEGYGAAAGLLPWIAAAYALQGIKQVFEAKIYAEKRTIVLVAVELAAAILAVGLYLTLIPTHGALGAALGTLGGMASSLVGMAVLSGAVPGFRRGGPRTR